MTAVALKGRRLASVGRRLSPYPDVTPPTALPDNTYGLRVIAHRM